MLTPPIPTAPASDASDSGDDSSSVPLTSQHSSASLPSLADEQPPPGYACHCNLLGTLHNGQTRVQWKGKGKKKKKQVDDGRVDLYALLGLQNERYLATDADLKNGVLICGYIACSIGNRWVVVGKHWTSHHSVSSSGA